LIVLDTLKNYDPATNMCIPTMCGKQMHAD
jgi:hypothetical protein